jgi:hypothetical protein
MFAPVLSIFTTAAGGKDLQGVIMVFDGCIALTNLITHKIQLFLVIESGIKSP